MNATLEAALEHGLSNFDRVIPDGLDEALRDGGECDYAGRNFYGRVWHENDKFKCKVWRHKMPGETLEADSLPELMTVVSNRWGYD